MSTADRTDTAPDAANVIAPPPLIYLTALGLGLAVNAVLPKRSIPETVQFAAGGALVLAGIVLARSFFRALGRARTTISPYRPSTELVTDGPYRLSRNPGYLGMTLACAGTAILANAPWALLPLPVAVAVIDRGVIAREERYLEREFGQSYADYKRRVRRWI